GWRKCGDWQQEVSRMTRSHLTSSATENCGRSCAGEMKLEEARTAIQQATRRYAKRQMTWFRREAGVHWLSGFGDDPEVQRQVLRILREELQGALPGRMDV